jgi:hypothetical protein
MDYCLAPFLGVALILVFFQNITLLNVPIRYSAPFFWIAVLAAWTGIVRRGHLRRMFRRFPARLWGACLIVYLVQGLGLLLLGARFYVGRAWTDMFNYTTWAQFLADVPFHVGWEAAANHPWLVAPISMRWDRSGQSVLHAFFAVTSIHDAKTLFAPTILLGPSLTVLAIYALGQKLGLTKPQAVTAGLASGLLPSLASVQVECFLSHSLAIPFLLIMPVLLSDLNRLLDWRSLCRAALVLSVTASVYPEFAPILFATIALSLGIALGQSYHRHLLLRNYSALVLTALILNPGSLVPLVLALNRVNMPVLGHVYPWAFSVEGLSRVWLGDWAIGHTRTVQQLIRISTVMATAIGYSGILKTWLDGLYAGGIGRDDKPAHYRFCCASCVLALCLLPLLVIAKDNEHPYQYYKLFLTISPLLVLGVALLWRPPALPIAVGVRWYPAVPAQVSLFFVIVSAIAGTCHIAWRAGQDTRHVRSCAPLLLTPDIRKLQERLRELPPSDVVQAINEPFLNSWFSYFARNHRVWLCCPDIVDVRLKEEFPANAVPKTRGWPVQLEAGRLAHIRPGAGTLDVRSLPVHAVILWQKSDMFQTVTAGRLTEIWTGESFRLSQTDGNDWALPWAIETPYPLQEANGHSPFWMGQGTTTLNILAGSPGLVTLGGTFHAGPALPETALRRLAVCTDAGQRLTFTTDGGQCTFTVRVPAGKSRILLTPLDRPTRAAPPGDTQMMLLGIQDLSFTFTPEAQARVPVPVLSRVR